MNRHIEAFECLLYDDWKGAQEILAEQYESVCETVSPALRAHVVHPVACHRFDQPEHVGEE